MTSLGRRAAAVGVRLRRRTRQDDAGPPATYSTSCAAPSIQLRFDPNGLVTACCKSLQPLGHIGSERLPQIWDGAVRHRMEAALAEDDFSVGCQRCGAEIAQEGREHSYAAIHDGWAHHLTTDPASRQWPVRMEFNLSNACNLQCIQCDGESSSAIRIHREKRPPLPKVYGDEFFADLVPFLPHLDRIVFAGGEPFLGTENFRVWDLVADHAPHIECMVVTNATQWSPRIEALLDRLRFSFVFSLDGITRETFEDIRVGADFDSVMANVERMRGHAAQAGTTASVNHCLMPQNIHEFGDLLLWAEAKDLFVNVSVVRDPPHASIASLGAEELKRAFGILEEMDDRVRPLLTLNRRTWAGEYDRLASWADTVGNERVAAHTVMWFRCDGTGPYDAEAARAELQEFSRDGRVHEFTVDANHLITFCDAPFLPESEALIGRSVRELTGVVAKQLGNMDHYEVRSTSEDRVDAWATFGASPTRITTVALRDDRGWADEARLLISIGSS